MKNIEKLNKYLENYFPNLKLCKPLFYNSEIGIRFEIGCSEVDSNDEQYIESVYSRSLQLFEEVFSKEDNILLVVNAHRSFDSESEMTNENEVFPVFFINPKNFEHELDSEEIPFCYLEEDESVEDSIKTIRYCYDCNLKKIKYTELLKAIANQDLGYKPAVIDEVYFINTDTNIIYHLYDDRGLDLISNNKASLEKLYIKYNSWILDYDRDRINNLFRVI